MTPSAIDQHASALPRWLGLPHQRRGRRLKYGANPPAARNASIRYYLALLIIGVITVACCNMAFVMADALPTNPDIGSRLAFLAEHTTRWQAGWLNWMAAAVGLLVFCILLTQHIPQGTARTFGLTAVAIGIAPDISAETIYAFVLPEVRTPETFAMLDRIAMLLTGFIGNGAYCLGGLVLNLALFRNPTLSRHMLYFGLPSWWFGLLISISTAAHAIHAAALFTAIAMTWSIAWMFWFTQTALRDPDRVKRYA